MERAKSLSESHHYEPDELLQNDPVDTRQDGYDSSSSSSSRFLLLKYFNFKYLFLVNQIKMKFKMQVILSFIFFIRRLLSEVQILYIFQNLSMKKMEFHLQGTLSKLNLLSSENHPSRMSTSPRQLL